jgi:Tfp pilus assembly protein PilV
MKREAGFTLISVMIAVVMLMVGIVALSRTGTMVVRAHTVAAARTTALIIARGHMEWVRGVDPANLVSASPQTVNAEGVQDPNGQFVRSVKVEDAARNLKRIVVTVDYPRSNHHPVELVTLTFVNAEAS